MFRSHRLLLAATGLLALAALGVVPARALEAGITLDVHQDISSPQLLPNDFHIEGLVCSNNGTVPALTQHIDGPFDPTLFAYAVTKLSPNDPTDCWYWFEASWVMPLGQYIPYCTVIHLGLLFDVDSSNIVIDLIGWWTRNGVPVGGMGGTLGNGGYVPLVGFNVQDTGTPQIITIGNGDLPITPVLPPPVIAPPPWPPTPITYQVLQMDVVPFPPGSPPNFNALSEFGQQQFYPWVPIVYADGTPINPGRPLLMAPDSFFDIFLETFGRTGDLRAQTATPIQPGGFLVARQKVRFTNNNNQSEDRWFWEIHGAQPAEACCFPDGHCEEVLPLPCLQRGGQHMGVGSTCAGTTCQVIELGACCYGTNPVLCLVTAQALCVQQYLGQWKGAGTTCADLDVDGVADICEPPVTGACCIQYSCTVMTQAACIGAGGKYRGDGTSCATPGICACRADTNCDGVISFADINPFVLALSNLSGWQSRYPSCPWQNCDVNGDGVVSFADINPFVARLGSSAPCP